MTIFLQSTAFTQKLHHLLKTGRIEAACRGQPVLISTTTEIEPVQPFVLFSRAQGQERILWEQPNQGFAMAAIGMAEQFIGSAEGRFTQITSAYRQLVAQALLDATHTSPLPTPVALGGFAFDPLHRPHLAWEDYPDALLVLPRFLFLSCGDASWLTVNLVVRPQSDASIAAENIVSALHELLSGEQTAIREESSAAIFPDNSQESHWKKIVTRVVKDIEHGTVEKLVLAREVHLRCLQSFNANTVLRRLRADYDSCTLFAFARGKSCFLGATPERLVRLNGRIVQVNCLAGSIARGATDDEDRALGEALLANHKERHEHALVTHTLRNALEPVCSYLSASETPSLLLLPNVQHLYTPMEGMLKKEADILDLVERLHPTPALGGVPREAALSLIRTYEVYGRGWYAGPVGWIDAHGGGEFVVAIRSALLRGEDAWLYAGCGIVSGSDAEREYEESCLKMRPMLWALNSK